AALALLRVEPYHVLGGRPLLALNDVELDPLAVVQRAETAALDGAVVHEDVLLAVVTRDEAEPLLRIEPLHRPGFLRHGSPPGRIFSTMQTPARPQGTH